MKSIEVVNWKDEGGYEGGDEGDIEDGDEGGDESSEEFDSMLSEEFWLLTDKRTDICDCRVAFATEKATVSIRFSVTRFSENSTHFFE